jgi:hypothetical protein
MKNRKNLLKGEQGQILVYVLIVAFVAALVVPPLVGLTYSGYRTASISNDKMAQFYAADTGIEDAIIQIINRGDDTGLGHNWKVPEMANTTTVSHYWIGDDDPNTSGENKAVVNGCNVHLDLTREGNDTYTYTIRSTSTEIYDGSVVEASKTKSIIQAQIIVGEGNRTVSGQTTGPAGKSPFNYAIATLGPSQLVLTASNGANPNVINGDIYSAGNMEIQSNIQVLGNSTRASSVWANGTLLMDPNSYVSGDAHSNGNMHLQAGAEVHYNAYANGSIVLDSAAKIGNSSYATGDITLNDFSTIDLNVESGGSISVLHSKPHPEVKTEIYGNASASQNITVSGASVDSSYKASAIIDGHAIYGGTITVLQPIQVKIGKDWYTYYGGAIYGGSTHQDSPAPAAPNLPAMPQIVSPNLSCWQTFYYEEAHGLHPVVDDPICPTALPSTGHMDGGPYESDTIYQHSKANISLGPKHVTYTTDYPTKDAIDLSNDVVLNLTGTVYVDGSVYISNNCQIVGGGKLVATGDINIQNSSFSMGNSTHLPFLMSINGDISLNNVGNVSAAIYAPNGKIDIGTNDYIFGSVVGESVTNGNNIVLTFDQRVQNIPGLPGGTTGGSETYPTSHEEPWFGPGAYIIWYNVVK